MLSSINGRQQWRRGTTRVRRCEHSTAVVYTLAACVLNLEGLQTLLQWYNNYSAIKPTKLRQLERIARWLLQTMGGALCSSARRQSPACAACEAPLLAAAGTRGRCQRHHPTAPRRGQAQPSRMSRAVSMRLLCGCASRTAGSAALLLQAGGAPSWGDAPGVSRRARR